MTIGLVVETVLASQSVKLQGKVFRNCSEEMALVRQKEVMKVHSVPDKSFSLLKSFLKVHQPDCV